VDALGDEYLVGAGVDAAAQELIQAEWNNALGREL
jgi:hypothetical protein